VRTLEEIKDNIRIIYLKQFIPPEKWIEGGMYMAEVRLPNGLTGSVVFSNNEDGWEHVSFSPFKTRITPSWDDMCCIKDIFWRDEEVAIQIHPAKKEYVNIKSNCLHLWSRGDLTLPDRGFKRP
jgi:hypothetical protein